MKTVDKMEVLHSQTPEFIEQGETGKFLKLIPDTFIIKGAKMEEGFCQGYAIRHLNRQDIVLIDTVADGMQPGIKTLVDDGYHIKALLLSGSAVADLAYADLKTISEDAGGAPIFAHPRNNFKDSFKVKDITQKNEVLKHFGITINDLPGNNGGSVLIYSDINEGMLFTGEDAIGAAYDSDSTVFTRPKLKSANDEYGLAESWGAYDKEFRYLFPLHGKPGFNLEEGHQTDILNRLSRVKE